MFVDYEANMILNIFSLIYVPFAISKIHFSKATLFDIVTMEQREPTTYALCILSRSSYLPTVGFQHYIAPAEILDIRDVPAHSQYHDCVFDNNVLLTL